MHFRAIHPVEEFLETRVNFRVGGTVVLGTIERIIQQKTFAGKNYSLFEQNLEKYVIENDINNLSLAKLLNI